MQPEEHKEAKPRSKRESYNHTFDDQRRQFLYDVSMNHLKIKDVIHSFRLLKNTTSITQQPRPF